MFYTNFNDVKYFLQDDQGRSKHFGSMTICVYKYNSSVSAFVGFIAWISLQLMAETFPIIRSIQ
jgi:hypothetical protein